MITRIEARRYRCFRELDVELGGFRVLAGANGAGKSTLLDISPILAQLVVEGQTGPVFFERQDDDAPPRALTPSDLVYRHQGDTFDLALEAAIPDDVQQAIVNTEPDLSAAPERIPNRLRYEVSLVAFNGRDLQVDAEYLILFNADDPRKGARPTRDADGALAGDRPRNQNQRYALVLDRGRGQTAVVQAYQPAAKSPARYEFDLAPTAVGLANVPADRRQFPVVTWFKSFLANDVRAYRPDYRQLREAAPSGTGAALQSDGANLPWLLHDLRQADPQAFADWVEHVRLALPLVEDVVPYIREGDRRATFRVVYGGAPAPLEIEASGLSEGTLRILALTAPAFLLSSPEVLIVEQPEDGLHPRALESVLGSFQLRLGGQVWTSTHSPVALAHVPLDDIIIVRPGPDGATAIPGPEHPSLGAWRGALNPGELYAAGILG